jgi:hypothetical protein
MKRPIKLLIAITLVTAALLILSRLHSADNFSRSRAFAPDCPAFPPQEPEKLVGATRGELMKYYIECNGNSHSAAFALRDEYQCYDRFKKWFDVAATFETDEKSNARSPNDKIIEIRRLMTPGVC